ncbi:MAG TPA: hypothetical protein VIW29_16700 [Polyangiaceae bacterium]
MPERPTFGDFWAALGAQIDALDGSALEPEYVAFTARHGVDAEEPGLRADFKRLWRAFEATRDGGWWRLRWQITDQEPSSLQIWKAWRTRPPQQSFSDVTAVAECDEITALFAITARRLGVRGVGLFYPTWNHVIAGWAPRALSGPARVVLVPTTQIFQSCESSFDQTSFRVPKQVYEFPRYDVRDSSEMPAPLARFLLEQVRAYAEASPTLLALIRAKRAELFQSSLGDCLSYRRQLADQLRSAPLSCADERALHHLALTELNVSISNDALLSFLASG